MLRILVPADGSENALRALRHAVGIIQREGAFELHLLNVQMPFRSGEVRLFISQEELAAYYRDEGERALRVAKALLDEAKIPYFPHIALGEIAPVIARFVHEKQCQQIVMGTRGLTAITGLLLGSVTTKVLHLVDVPVTLLK